jgi:quercetin dioxygenase-like cupin family protein
VNISIVCPRRSGIWRTTGCPWLAGVLLLAGLIAAACREPDQVMLTAASRAKKERARILLSKELPKSDGMGLKVTLLEVSYQPGEASPAHSHPCAVVGYVVAGSLRTQLKGEPVMTYRAGESFYEDPNGVHLLSANASSSEPAKFVAYLVCDPDAPLSVDTPETELPEGGPR